MDSTLPSEKIQGAKMAEQNWRRYEYARTRGHRDYCDIAILNERYYLGGGLQYPDEVRAAMGNRPLFELNEIFPALNTVIGYQIQNRMDIQFAARGSGADEDKATIFSKYAMWILDQVKFRWKESDVFADGMIQQRGYFDIRMKFQENIQGDVTITVPDPMDVIPDPDANSYDPDEWGDVVTSKWMMLDEIEAVYGKDKRVELDNLKTDDSSWGHRDATTPRNHFGDDNTGTFDSYYKDESGIRRVRVLERQRWEYAINRVAVNLDTGDVTIIQGWAEDKVQELVNKGYALTKRFGRRVKWEVTTRDTELFSDYSEYPWFTIVPFFPYFRRGKTRGMVDNAIGPQDILNKSISSSVHIVNSTANSGWSVEEGSLTNMDTDQLEESGSDTGLIIEYKKGTQPPSKIQPNQVPTGTDRLVQIAQNAIKEVTVPDAMRGIAGPETSGIAIQSKQHAAQSQLALPLDNLMRTRNMFGNRLWWCMRNYMTTPRTIYVTETDPATMKQVDRPYQINQPTADGSFMNDITVGEYDLVITEVPIQSTFENSQFNQMVELRKDVGVRIPDDYLIRHSNLSDKADLVAAMTSKPDPMQEAQAALIKAQAQVAEANAITKTVEGMFSATTTANLVAQNPAIAPVADMIYRSAGGKDADLPPIIPGVQPGTPSVPTPENTHPILPPNPDVGAATGMEATP